MPESSRSSMSSAACLAPRSRRDFLQAVALSAATLTLGRFAQAATTASRPLAWTDATWRVRPDGGRELTAPEVHLDRNWSGGVCRSRLTNAGPAALAIKEVVLFAGPHGFGGDTTLYGESFQMLSQTYGTLARPLKLGYDELKHYRLPEVPGAITVRAFALLSPAGAARQLLGFSSCRRFSGEIRLWPDRFEVVLDTEGRELRPGAAWELEEFVHATGDDREGLLAEFAGHIERSHRRLRFPKVPTGWCSWYYYGKRLAEEDIRQNMDAIARDGAALEYIQIDDGYQPAHGDWLDGNPKFFPSGIKALCHTIRDRGFQPAIWVAPFIAAPKSRLLRERPEWFVKGPDGKPLAADQVTFAGWNEKPWYMLDATIPAVQDHLERIFRVMREEWGCTYFKLDANFWGTVHGSRFADADATRIDNYRRGMAAILRGAGDAFILGCNAPMWASLGLVHGMRITGDIKRTWAKFSGCARELFFRNWQHDRLWINDPDCLVASPLARSGPAPVTADEISFHAAAIVASGGMMLNGDNFATLTAAEKAVVRRTLPPNNAPARFADESFREGVAQLADGRRLFFVFNWDDEPVAHTIDLGGAHALSDFWSDEPLGTHRRFTLPALPPRSARVIVAAPG